MNFGTKTIHVSTVTDFSLEFNAIEKAEKPLGSNIFLHEHVISIAVERYEINMVLL